MSTSAVTPDPYAAYGGSVASGGGADPYAAYGGEVVAANAPNPVQGGVTPNPSPFGKAFDKVAQFAVDHEAPIGMTVGGIGGGLIAGPPGAAVGAGLGGAVGKAAQQHANGLDTNAWPQVKQQLEDGAIGLGSELLIPAIGGAWSRIPTTAKAGQLFSEVMDAAKDVPVNLTRTQPALDRVAQLTDAGAPVMNAPNKLLLRSQTINPIKYPEARDFYSNISNLSAQDKLALNGPMKKAVGDLREAFKGDIGDAATSAGKGEEYYKAMNQYRQAMRNKEVVKAAGKVALKYGVPATGAAVLYPALHFLMGLNL